jgi:hypothetical protein
VVPGGLNPVPAPSMAPRPPSGLTFSGQYTAMSVAPSRKHATGSSSSRLGLRAQMQSHQELATGSASSSSASSASSASSSRIPGTWAPGGLRSQIAGVLGAERWPPTCTQRRAMLPRCADSSKQMRRLAVGRQSLNPGAPGRGLLAEAPPEGRVAGGDEVELDERREGEVHHRHHLQSGLTPVVWRGRTQDP